MSESGRRIGCGCSGRTGIEKENVIKTQRTTYEEIRITRTEEIRTEQYLSNVPHRTHRSENVRETRAPLIDVNDRHQYAPVPQKLVAPTRVAARPSSNIKPIRRVIPQQPQSYTSNPSLTIPTKRSLPITSTVQRPYQIPSTRRTLPITSTVQRPSSNRHSITSSGSTVQKPSQTYIKWLQDETNSTGTYYTARSAETGDSLESTTPDLSNHVKVEYSKSEVDETNWATFRTNQSNVGYGPHKTIPHRSLPLQINDEATPQMVVHDGVPSLRKKTFRRNVMRESEYLGIVNLDPHLPKVHPFVLYSEYIDDIIINALEKEERHTLEQYFIKRFNLKQMTRAVVVNWLIKLQQYFGSDSSVFFTSVRLMDKIISIRPISDNMLQLIGIVCFWIASKMGDVIDAPKGSLLLQLCNHKYTYEKLHKMECKLLNVLNFELNVDEPMLFVRYYLLQMELKNCNIISICCNYLLDLFMLDPESNTTPVSLQGASAVVLSLELLHLDPRFWYHQKQMPGYHSLIEMTNVHQRMLAMVRWMHRDDCKLRDIYKKYATEKYGSISLKLHQIVV